MVAGQKEKIFREAIVRGLRKNMRNMHVQVESHKNLCYSLHMTDNGDVEPHVHELKRGHDAFQQDIVIFETRNGREIPRVVIETKIGGCSTHEAMTYSNKARLLKQVYPFLRYILAISQVDRITPKLIKHGEFFDGILILDFGDSQKIEKDEKWGRFVDVVRKEVDTSRKIGKAREGLLSIKAFLKSITIIES